MEFDNRSNYYLCIEATTICEVDAAGRIWKETYDKMDIAEEFYNPEDSVWAYKYFRHYNGGSYFCTSQNFPRAWPNSCFKLMTDVDKLAYKYGI